ncbi:MAG: hypothetical protein KGL39_53535, partial [Patescibacteria group bacterium]|nr:hypothetical protein [Patescibacteria group bacterium]
MKRIVTMTGEGFASRSLSHKITPVTVFTGPNRRGKTTRLNLVAWVLAGYVPNVAARSSDVYKELGIGQNMTGELTFDDGSFIRRRLIGQKSGVKANMTQQGFADDFAVPPVLVDAREFLNLSERERVKFVFRLTSSAADRSKVGQTVIANLKGLKLDEHTPEAEAALTDLVAEVQNTIEEGARDNKPVNELVDELCEQVRTAKNEADANSKRMAKTNEGVAQVAQDEAPPSPDCEYRLTQSRAHHREKFGRMTEIKTELQQVQRQIEQAREAEKQVQGEQLIRNQIKQLEANPPASPMAVGTKPELQKMAEPRPSTANEQARLNEARQRLDEAKRVLDDSLFSVRKIELEIAQAEKQTHCPTCGHDITDTQKQIVANLRNALAAAWAVNTSKTSVMAIAQGIWSDAEKALQSANQAVANWDTSKKQMEDENQRMLYAWNEVNEWHNRAQQAVNQHQASLNRLRQTLAKTAEQASIAAKLPTLEQEYQKLQNQADAATLDNDQAFNECTRLESEVRRLHAQREQAAQRARVDE